ncbi:hypothetical protein PR003_g841 [Phytophthora rubi]|uniref:Uncharacterized protein n=1 Tax=Phytophthora rubi TaxID=129364 RepID=A0A6A4G251_9STRA|nr:hypothetical protein PR002_g659 [Phytophthora rubi]KAE9052266.1 hypothetical protein PR001_g671 [Phytophthora rubi]KAE9359262.1 hypothetical protein PR003_g841 [Phytophthora rubi]
MFMTTSSGTLAHASLAQPPTSCTDEPRTSRTDEPPTSRADGGCGLPPRVYCTRSDVFQASMSDAMWSLNDLYGISEVVIHALFISSLANAPIKAVYFPCGRNRYHSAQCNLL